MFSLNRWKITKNFERLSQKPSQLCGCLTLHFNLHKCGRQNKKWRDFHWRWHKVRLWARWNVMMTFLDPQMKEVRNPISRKIQTYVLYQSMANIIMSPGLLQIKLQFYISPLKIIPTALRHRVVWYMVFLSLLMNTYPTFVWTIRRSSESVILYKLIDLS